MADRLSREEIEERIRETGWFHSIDLGQGVVTSGRSTNEIARDLLPDVAGKTVLDIGAWDGLNSFWAESAGAARVVAMDRYVWGVDIDARDRYWDECAATGTFPDHGRDREEFFDPALPWKRGFDIAHEILDSRVEVLVADLPDLLGAADVEVFDVTLCLGVLYHLPDPFGGLRALRRVTGEVAVVETEAIAIVDREDLGLCQFLAGDELNRDFGNWFRFSAKALEGMCRAAGFSRVDVVRGPPPPVPEPSPVIWRSSKADRENFRRTNEARMAPTPYRIVLHAFV
jgi:tRNA (mo5U34)-methyltransferase